MYLHEGGGILRQAVAATSNAFGLSESYVPKDYFAVIMLKGVMQRDADLVFKGGTCLSKCYGIIRRVCRQGQFSQPHVR